MSFEELKEVFVDTLNCDADKVTMEASLTEDLEADSLDAVELNMALEDACKGYEKTLQLIQKRLNELN